MSSNFVHLHVHTQYSLLDGAVDLAPSFGRCKEIGQTAMAITDHGTLAGAVDFYTQAHENGIKPVMGVEVYMVQDARKRERQPMRHLTLLAKNNAGYENLLKLVTLSNFEGFYYKPRIDKTMLSKHSDGIIILTGCNQGEVSQYLKKGEVFPAEMEFEYLRGLAPTYLEIQYHGLKDQSNILSYIPQLLSDKTIKTVITNDVHYLTGEDEVYHDALLAIQTKADYYNPARFKFDSKQLYLKTQEELFDYFVEERSLSNDLIDRSLTETQKIADMCEVELPLGGTKIPKFPSKMKPDEELKLKLKEGLDKRGVHSSEAVEMGRIKMEYDTIVKMGFSSYFLILEDLISWCAANGIATGPGRGSVVGSYAAYILGITKVNPLDYGLIFERFLNDQRFSPPDIDLDVSQEFRDRVFGYLEYKYGKENVAQILTFGTIGAKAAVKDCSRILGSPDFVESNRLTKLIPDFTSLKDAISLSSELQLAKSEYPLTFKLALGVEGSLRHKSVHAAGIVIGDKPLVSYVPLESNDNGAVCEASMYSIEKLGLLKIDILGLRNLDILNEAISLIKTEKGISIDVDDIPLEDAYTFSMLNDGNTFGLFQVETKGLTKALTSMQPYTLEELGAVISLPRPGVKEMLPQYLENKNSGYEMEDKRLDKILRSTYGVPIYQEQLMEIAKDCANFTMQEADILRKAIGKKQSDLLKTLKNKFVKGCKENNYTKEQTFYLWRMMEKASTYVFNKSHALGYAILAYWEGYIKFHYPEQYYVAMLNRANDDVIMSYILGVSSHIGIKGIDINQSNNSYRSEEGGIRIGFKAVKYVGDKLGMAIEIERQEGGDFYSVMDFCTRVNPNLNAVRALVSVGAFDSLFTCASRDTAVATVKEILQESRRAKLRKRTQEPKKITIPGGKKNIALDVKMEQKFLGFSTSILGNIPKGAVKNFKNSAAKNATIEGVLLESKEINTKQGYAMSFVKVLDSDGEHDLVLFPKGYAKLKDKIEGLIMERVELDVWKSYSDGYGLSIIINDIKRSKLERV